MILHVNPEWVKTFGNNYYFDLDTNKIYGPKNNTCSYWHEVSHYLDHKKPWYRKISILINQMNQMIALLFIVGLFIGLFISKYQWPLFFQCIGFMFIPYCLWSVQEEIRADINGIIWREQNA